MNGTVFFSVTSAAFPDPNKELWKTDGTEGGTVLVKAIPYPTLTQFANLNGKLIFHADDQGATGDAIYASDGTDAGTIKLKEFKYRYLRKIVVAGQYAYFSAKFGNDSSQLWRTDGTVAGTIALTSSTVATVNTDNMAASNGMLYFRTNGDPTFDAKNELWKTDGTLAGTSQIGTRSTATTFFVIDNMADVNGTLYFKGYDFTSTPPHALWKSNGTDAGTVKVKAIDPQTIVNLNGTAYFAANGNNNGVELWKTDGTDAGTVMVTTIRPGFINRALNRFTVAGNKGYFLLYTTGNSKGLFVTDGTDAGTMGLGNVATSSVGIFSVPMLVVDETVYYGNSEGGYAYFSKTKGTQATTSRICNFQMNTGLEGLITEMAVIGQTLLFNPFVNETGRVYGKELWKYRDITIANKEVLPAEIMTLSPNPAQSAITIGGVDRITGVEAVSVSGMVVRLVEHKGMVQVSGLRPGLYTLRVQSGAGATMQRFIKE